jgi:lipopolysaccharide exporter
MYSLYRRIKSNEFVAAVLTLMTGTIVGQAIPILASPILTRIYSPEQYGEYGTIVASCSILVILSTLRLDHAIVVQPNNRSAQYLMHAVFCTAAFVSLFVLLANLISYILIRDEFIHSVSVLSVSFIATLTFVSAVSLVFNNYAIRQKRFVVAAKSKIILFACAVGFQIILGNYYSGNGLVVGQLIGITISVGYLASYSLSFKRPAFRYFSIKNMTHHVYKNKKFPQFSLPFSLINSISRNIPIFFLMATFGKEFVGYYILATTVVLAPMSLVGNSIAQVYYRQAAKINALGSSTLALSKSVYANQIKIAIFPCVVLAVFAPTGFMYVFGPEWKEAGIYVRLLMPWLFMIFLNTPIMNSVYINNSQETLLIYEICLFVTRLIGFVIGAYCFADPRDSIAIFSAVSFLFQVYLSYILFGKLRLYAS